MTPEKDLELSIKSLKAYHVAPEIIKNMLDNLDKIKSSNADTFTKEQVYRIVANFSLTTNTEAFCGGQGNTTNIAKELKQGAYVDFSGQEILR